jgi:hypothetical protein
MSRIAEARARAASAKTGIAVAAVAAFLGAVVLERASHPGHTRSSSSSSSATAAQDGSGFFQSGDDGGALAPAQQAPQLSTGSS